MVINPIKIGGLYPHYKDFRHFSGGMSLSPPRMFRPWHWLRVHPGLVWIAFPQPSARSWVRLGFAQPHGLVALKFWKMMVANDVDVTIFKRIYIYIHIFVFFSKMLNLKVGVRKVHSRALIDEILAMFWLPGCFCGATAVLVHSRVWWQGW